MKLIKCYKKPEFDYSHGASAVARKYPDQVFYNTIRNGFVSAVAMAYNYHLPLILSPNDLWLVVLQGFRLHMSLNRDKEYMKFTFKDMDKIHQNV